MLRYQRRHDNRIYKHYGNTFRDGFYLRTLLRMNSTLKKREAFLVTRFCQILMSELEVVLEELEVSFGAVDLSRAVRCF